MESKDGELTNFEFLSYFQDIFKPNPNLLYRKKLKMEYQYSEF